MPKLGKYEYEVDMELGQGSEGKVYKGRDTQVGTNVSSVGKTLL